MNTYSTKALIADTTCEFGTKIADCLSSNGIYAYTRKKDINIIIDSVLRDKPDVLITDLEYPQGDALAVISRVRELGAKVPKTVIVSPITSSFVRRWAIEHGASCFIQMPCEPDEILENVNLCLESNNIPEDDALEILTTEAIRKLGVPAHIKGYSYLRTAVMDSVRDFRLMESVTKQLYPSVAAAHHTTPSRVERAIRHAIDSAWVRGGENAFSAFFGYSDNNARIKPTNSELIAMTADKLRLELKNQI